MNSSLIATLHTQVPWAVWLGVGICLAVFFSAALVACIKDYKERILPNICIGIMFSAALIFQMLRNAYPGVFPYLPLPFDCMWGCIVFMVAFFLFELLMRKTTDTSGFGAGDIKFIGAWALLMGPVYALVGGTVGALVGAIVFRIKKETTFAAGPWILGTSLIVFLVSAFNLVNIAF